MSKYAAHPLAEMFPLIDASGLKNLAERIKKNGLQEKGVLLDGFLLDGRNRQAACEIAGVPFDVVRWENLPKELTRNGPLEYVFDRNFSRRQLSPSQSAAAAADYAERLEKELKDAGISTESEEGGKKKKAGRGKTAAIAAKKFGVSTRSVETAKSVKKKSPKKFAEVKAGKKKVSKAAKELSKADKAKQDHEAALRRIHTVAGKNLADAARKGTRLKGRKEVMAYAALSDADMKRTQGLIESGWPVKKATAYKAKTLTPTHKLSDLIDRATAEGGKFDCEVSGWTIAVSRAKKS
jgi:hypothetical protein